MKRVLLSILLLCVCSFVSIAQTVKEDRYAPKKDARGWERAGALIASTPERRFAVLRQFGMDEGEQFIAFMIPNCEKCDLAAKLMEERFDSYQMPVVIFVSVPPRYLRDVRAWERKLSLRKVKVRNVTHDQFNRLGASLLPAIVRIRNGQAIEARDDAPSEDDAP